MVEVAATAVAVVAAAQTRYWRHGDSFLLLFHPETALRFLLFPDRLASSYHHADHCRPTTVVPVPRNSVAAAAVAVAAVVVAAAVAVRTTDQDRHEAQLHERKRKATPIDDLFW